MGIAESGTGCAAHQAKPYERLKAWAACYQLALTVYAQTASWPKSEAYTLTAQARRAALSAVLNIAEGSAKRGGREFRRYLDIALGSLTELACVLLLARDVGLIQAGPFGEVETLRDHANRLTWGLYRAVGSKAKQEGTGAS
jgi:four helix bundle protein